MDKEILIALLTGGMAFLGGLVTGIVGLITTRKAQKYEAIKKNAVDALEELLVRLEAVEILSEKLQEKDPSGRTAHAFRDEALALAKSKTNFDLKIGGKANATKLLKQLQ